MTDSFPAYFVTSNSILFIYTHQWLLFINGNHKKENILKPSKNVMHSFDFSNNTVAKSQLFDTTIKYIIIIL